jgi:hypothetical protein
MWNNYIVENSFLNERHFNLIKSIPFNTDNNSWEIYKHQIFLDKTIKVSYKNTNNYFGSSYLNKLDILDLYDTYHNRMISYLSKLCPDKVSKYKFTELNVVSTGKDYKFHIHNDSIDKLLSVVIYIAPENNMGTILYDTKEGLNPYIIEWEPNKAFIFSRNEHTWHSYEADMVNQRVTLVYNLRG